MVGALSSFGRVHGRAEAHGRRPVGERGRTSASRRTTPSERSRSARPSTSSRRSARASAARPSCASPRRTTASSVRMLLCNVMGLLSGDMGCDDSLSAVDALASGESLVRKDSGRRCGRGGSARASSVRLVIVQLAIDVPEVGLDRLGAEKERGRDALVRRALGHHRRDLQLLRRSTRRSARAGRGRARPPLERSSRAAFSAHGNAPSASKRWCASCRCLRASTRRPSRRRRSPQHSSVRARSNGDGSSATRRCASTKTASAVSAGASSPRQRAAVASAQPRPADRACASNVRRA